MDEYYVSVCVYASDQWYTKAKARVVVSQDVNKVVVVVLVVVEEEVDCQTGKITSSTSSEEGKYIAFRKPRPSPRYLFAQPQEPAHR